MKPIPRAPLTPEQQALAAKWSGLVPWTLRRLSWMDEVRRHEDDCRGAAALALVKAATSWRPGAGIAFTTYAAPYMRFAVLSEVRKVARRQERQWPAAGLDVPDPAGAVATEGLAQDVAAAVASLDGRDREVIELRFGLGGRERLTLNEVGAAFGITSQRVGQIERRALAALAPALAALA